VFMNDEDFVVVYADSPEEAMLKLRDAGESRAVRRPPSSVEGSCPRRGSSQSSTSPTLPQGFSTPSSRPHSSGSMWQRNWQATRAWLQRTNLWRERTNLSPRTRSVQKIIQGYSTSGAVHSSAAGRKFVFTLRTVAAAEVVHDGLTLSVEAEPGLSRLVCADPVIRDKSTEMRGLPLSARRFGTSDGRRSWPTVFPAFVASKRLASTSNSLA